METQDVESVQQELSDKEVVERILSGEKRLFELLIRKYNQRLYRIARSIVTEDSEIEDLMQCAYIRAYEHLGKFEWRSSFSTWLVRILVNECLSHLKKKHRVMVTDIDDELSTSSYKNISSPTPVSVVLNKELAQALEEALLNIPEKYRTVFVMREIEDMSVAETVEALALSESNVKVRLNRAKSMLQEKLNSYYKNDLVFHFYLTRCDRIVQNVFNSLGIV
ncbi:MAG TPA: RNA polymerase sigma factor [Flavipsychrobacter sp.]|nr:RNA polymerase sigma factor [Flavipsychrobacter sp.]